MNVVYENNEVKVFENNGEIFVQLQNSLMSLYARITPQHDELRITASNGRLVPWAVNGLPAIRVTEK